MDIASRQKRAWSRAALVAALAALCSCSSGPQATDGRDAGGKGGSAGGPAGTGGHTNGTGGAAGAGQAGAAGGAGQAGGAGGGGGQAGAAAGAGRGGTGGLGGAAAGGRGGAAGGAGGAGAGIAGRGGAGGAGGGAQMTCEPAFAGGLCNDASYRYCGTSSSGVCCPPASPYYCSTSNLCYATAQQAAAACPGAACVACTAQASGTCSVAPTGGSCLGYPGYLFCGGICCPANLPYFCSTTNLCYASAAQAAGACPAAGCVQCSSTCAPPPSTLPTGGVEGICGGEQPLAVIDGIPAYPMCNAALSGNVWSNNGTGTAAMSEGAGWVETQTGIIGTTQSGGYQCTELATRYFYFKFGICPWISTPAKDMCTGPLPSSITLTTTPVHGDLVVVTPGCDGSDPTTGHVAVVDQVGATSVTAVQEHAGSLGESTFHTSCVTCFLHATANTGH